MPRQGAALVESTWWRSWDPGQEAELPASAIAAVRAQPRFHEAFRHTMLGVLQLSDRGSEFHRIIVDNLTTVLGVTALHLDATGGLTHRRLRDFAGVKGALSGGRISAVLLRMQMIGYVHAATQPVQGAVKVYRPTLKMTAAFQVRFRLELESILIMAPEMADQLAYYDTPEGFRAFMALLGAYAADAVRRPRPELRALEMFGTRRAGGLVLAALIVAAAEAADRFPAAGPAVISMAALSRRFRVSRTHILRLLREAEAVGFFTRGAADGEGVVQPALVEALEIYCAACWIGFAVLADLAMRARPVIEVAA